MLTIVKMFKCYMARIFIKINIARNRRLMIKEMLREDKKCALLIKEYKKEARRDKI